MTPPLDIGQGALAQLRAENAQLRAALEPEVNDAAHWIRLFNRLDAAISHHRNAHLPHGRFFADLPDDALWKARDKIITDAAAGRPDREMLA